MATAKTPQEAMRDGGRYALSLGPNHSDAMLVIEDCQLRIEAPGVETILTVEIAREIAYVCGGWANLMGEG